LSTLIFVAIVLSLIPHAMQYGPQAALIAESFTPRLPYSGASIGYQLASITAGGPAPLIATALFATYRSSNIRKRRLGGLSFRSGGGRFADLFLSSLRLALNKT
jgi:hypothetical protein